MKEPSCLYQGDSFFSTPSMGVIYTVKVRNGGWRAPTISQG